MVVALAAATITNELSIRLVGIMLKNLIIILFRISPKKLTLCFYYSPTVLIILKIIPNFYNFLQSKCTLRP